jgi:hypothetical protein
MSARLGLRHVVVVTAITLAAAACGSTVYNRAGRFSGGGGELGLPSDHGVTSGSGSSTATSALLASGAAGGQSAGGGAGAGGFGGAGGAAGAGTVGGFSGSRSAGGLVPAVGPGITDTTIFIGAEVSSQSAAGDRALGAAGAAPSYDLRDVTNAVINYANSHGGFARRHMQAIYFDVNLTADRNIQDQSACADFTQDHKVFALVSATTDILVACAEKAHAVPVGAGSATAQTFQQFPHLVDPDLLRLDRLGSVTTSGLSKAGYFTGKLGLVTWDDSNYRYAVTQGYLPALSALGITPTQTAYITVPQQIGALGDTSAAVNSAVTKFRALGIDHVIIQDGPAGVFSGAGLTFEWLNQAKSQQWYPRYGGNLYNAPDAGIYPTDELNHSLYVDQSDDDPKFDQGWQPNAARQQCFKIEADAGLPPMNANDEGLATQVCDLIFLMQNAIGKVPVISADSFIQAVAGLGTSFPTAFVYGSKFFPGRRDGGDEVRTEEYVASCQCLKYSGPPYYPD